MLRSSYGASFSMGKKAGSGLGMEPEKTAGKGPSGVRQHLWRWCAQW